MTKKKADFDYESVLFRISDRIVERDGCWEWIGATNSQGLPVIRDPRTMAMRSVKQVLAEAKGHNTKGHRVMLKCKNPACVNPDHFSLLAVKRIMRIVARMGNEAQAKSPLNYRKGLHARKLTPEQVLEIRDSNDSYRVLSERFNINTKTIARIKKGQGYRDVTMGKFWSGLMRAA